MYLTIFLQHLFICLRTYFLICLFTNVFPYLFTHLFTNLFPHVFLSLHIYLVMYVFTYVFTQLFTVSFVIHGPPYNDALTEKETSPLLLF